MSKRLPVNFVQKSWGWEKWLVNKPEYCGKILFFAKGKSCSFHYHKKKDEVFFLQEGRLEVVYLTPKELLKIQNMFKFAIPDFEYMDEERKSQIRLETFARSQKVVLEPGDCFDVPPGTIHQMTGLLDSYLFEFSTQHFDEDSYRIIKGD